MKRAHKNMKNMKIENIMCPRPLYIVYCHTSLSPELKMLLSLSIGSYLMTTPLLRHPSPHSSFVLLICKNEKSRNPFSITSISSFNAFSQFMVPKDYLLFLFIPKTGKGENSFISFLGCKWFELFIISPNSTQGKIHLCLCI